MVWDDYRLVEKCTQAALCILEIHIMNWIFQNGIINVRTRPLFANPVTYMNKFQETIPTHTVIYVKYFSQVHAIAFFITSQLSCVCLSCIIRTIQWPHKHLWMSDRLQKLNTCWKHLAIVHVYWNYSKSSVTSMLNTQYLHKCSIAITFL